MKISNMWKFIWSRYWMFFFAEYLLTAFISDELNIIHVMHDDIWGRVATASVAIATFVIITMVGYNKYD